MKILAVDPGKTTGFAQWWEGAFVAFQCSDHVAAEFVRDNVVRYDVVTCESFVINRGTVYKKKDSVATMKLLGWVEWSARLAEVEFTSHTAAKAKTFATNEKLRHLGWYGGTPGGHANDACRHLLIELVERKVLGAEDLVKRPSSLA